jgi:hypothetical protein
MDVSYEKFRNTPSSNTECIDVESIELIKNFISNLLKPKFRSEHRNVDDFFTQIEFDKYLMQFHDRLGQLEHMQGVVSSEELKHEFSKRNSVCLKFATRVNELAQKEYDKFNELSRKYHHDDKYKENGSLRTWMKRLTGIGTKSKYETRIDDIPSCLYWTMLKFSEAILEYEKEKAKPQLEEASLDKLIALLSLDKLKALLPKPNAAEGGSRRHTRHWRGRGRHHSMHSHTSAKRTKNGKKSLKSHSRKRYTRA